MVKYNEPQNIPKKFKDIERRLDTVERSVVGPQLLTEQSEMRTPAPPTNFAVVSRAVLNETGEVSGAVRATWDAVNEATFGTPLEISHYELWARPVEGEQIWRRLTASTELFGEYAPLPSETQWVFRVRAIARSSTSPGEYSNEVVVIIKGDDTAPPVPTTPVLSTRASIIGVRWDGYPVMPSDFSHVEVAMGPASSPTAVIGRLTGEGTLTVTDQPYNQDRHFRFRSVDRSGNKSEWGPASVIATIAPADVDARAAVDQALADLEAARQEIAATGTELGGRLQDAEAELEAAEGRLAEAEASLNQAFPGGAFDLEDRFSTTLKSTTIQYAVNSSETTAPTTGWSSNTPTRTPGTFVWFRTVLTYADNTSTTTNPALLTGNTGAKGDSGNDGLPGADGVGVTGTTIAYARSANGSTAPTTGWQSTVPSPIKGQYLWTRTVWTYTNGSTETGYTSAYWATDGAPGNDGIAGKDGVGITGTAITYAQSTSGTTAPTTGWVATPPSPIAGRYIWTKTVWTYSDNTTETGYSVGKIGDTGAKGDKGDTGNDGLPGAAGVGLTGTAVTYARSTSGSTAPTTGWTTAVPTVIKGQYLWTRTVWTYTNGSTETGYSSAYWATDGAPGNDGIAGKDGVGITGTAITYAQSTSGTTAPTTGWVATPPSPIAGRYIWTKTVWTYSDASTETGYSVGKIGDTGAKGDTGSQGIQGPPGANGATLYTWLKYAPNGAPSSAQMSDSPAGMTHMGLAYNQTSSTEGTNPSAYTWSLIKGADGGQGVQGPPGTAGQSLFTWVRYAPNGAPSSAQMTATPVASSTHIGLAYNKPTASATNTPGDYTWALIQGPKGDTGGKGDTGDQGVGVSSVIPYYRAGTSTPAAPSGASPSGWSTTEPAYSENNNLYRAEKVTYTNGTVVWTPVTMIASYEGTKQARLAAQAAQLAADNTAAAVEAYIRSGNNLIRNGDMEQGDTGWNTTAQVSFPQVTDAHSGNRVMRLSGPWSVNLWPDQTNPVKNTVGRTYYVEAWFRRVSGPNNDIGLAIRRYDAQGGSEGSSRIAQAPGPAELGVWEKVSTTWTNPYTNTAQIGFAPWTLGGSASTTVIDVDDVLVVDVTEAEAARKAAEAAHGAAGDAQGAASNALSAATHTGKNLFSDSDPAGLAPYGTIWMKRDPQSNNRIVGQWQQVGGSAPAADGTGGQMGGNWQKRDITSEVIANLDVGKLTADTGTITDLVARHIAGQTSKYVEADIGKLTVTAGATINEAVIPVIWNDVMRSRKITSDMLLVGQGANYLPDPRFNDPVLTAGRRSRSSIPAGTTDMTTTQFFYFIGPNAALETVAQYAIPVLPGEQYRINIPVTNGLTSMLQVERFTATNSRTLESNTSANITNVTYENGILSGQYRVPTGAVYFAPVLYRTGSSYTVQPGASVSRMADSSLIVDGGIAARHLNVVHEDLSTGNRLSLQPDGLRLWSADDVGEPTISLTTSSAQSFAILDQDDNVIAGLDSSGGVVGHEGSFDELYVGGTELTSILDNYPKGLIYSRNFPQTRSLRSKGGHSYIFFDALPWRIYKITCRLRYRNRDSKGVVVSFHGTNVNSGSTPAVPVVTSPEITEGITYTSPDGYQSGSWMNQDYDIVYSPAGTVPKTIGILVAAAPIEALASPMLEVGSAWWTVEDLGPVANAGLNKDGGYSTSGGNTGGGGSVPTPEPTPKKTYTTRYTASSWRTFERVTGSATGSYTTSVTGPMQGYTSYYPSAGQYGSNWYFNHTQIMSDLSGADVISARVKLTARHTHSGSGGTARLYAHNVSATSTWRSAGHLGDKHFSRGQSHWLGVGSDEWRTGTYRGIGVWSDSTSSEYYMRFDPSAVLEITYQK